MTEIFFDGSCSSGMMGIGLVVVQDGVEERNESFFAGIGDSNLAEWMAFANALKAARNIRRESRTEQIVLKTDSKNVINQFKGRSRVVIGDVVRRSIILASQLPDLRVTWIRSEKNLADQYAKAGLRN
ncbi:MAG: bifunctional RNase H/acid phosphatase [Syntrophorhabdaceae bacterium PtaU1.Bin034]|nr:MAG: bifunctional RNase H/acid phosphatase [Syntrophorhabdaceae bacterium PtaU1.Bin034]